MYLFAVFGFMLAFWLGGVGLFVWKWNVNPIKSRGRVMAILQTFFVVYHTLVMCIVNTYFDTVPCLFQYFVGVVIFPLWTCPFFYRVAFPAWYHFRQGKRKLKYRTTFDASKSSMASMAFLLDVRFQILIHLAVAAVLYVCGILIFYLMFGQGWGNDFAEQPGDYCMGYGLLYFVSAQFAVIFVLVALTVYSLWHVHDPHHLKDELKILLGISLVIFPLWVLFSLNVVAGAFPSHVLYVCYALVIFVVLYMPAIWSFTDQRRMKRSSTARSIEVRENFDSVMKDPGLLRSFQEFCVQRWCVEGVLFYEEILNYKAAPPNKRPDLAIVLLSQFLNDNATLSVNIDGVVKRSIAERIKKEDIDESLFDEAEKEIEHFLRYGVYQHWLEERKGNAEPTTLARNHKNVSQVQFEHDPAELDIFRAAESPW